MSIVLRPLVEADLGFLAEVRHHPETLSCLHDQRTFSPEETLHWFRQTQPQWLVIENDRERVGYIRTSDRDTRNRSLKIGADIHPKFRRQGLAKAAYEILFEQLMLEGWDRVWLEVLPSNVAALALYRQLGFHFEGRLIGAVKRGNSREDSLVMGRLICPPTGRNAKVVVVYLGPRRFRPACSQESYQLLNFLLEQELSLDPGCLCDTLLIHNRDEHAPYNQDPWVRRCEELLERVDGTATPQGQMRLITRKNVGISFGAYHHAFESHRRMYDYWLFTEDDQVLVKPGCFGRGIEQMQADPTVGFVAIVGASIHHGFPPHAHGGVGISSRSVLREVLRANPCERHPLGHLPYHWEPGYADQERLGEIRFTNAIHQLGYRLIDHDWDEICVSWGQPQRRTSRMIPWTPDMASSTFQANVNRVAVDLQPV